MDQSFPLEPLEENYRGEVANRYGYKDGSGEIGIIASVTQPFCGDCTRVRLSAAGELFTCLFGNKQFDLRDMLRDGSTDDEIIDTLTNIWQKRNDRYSEMRTSFTKLPAKGAEMYRIGG